MWQKVSKRSSMPNMNEKTVTVYKNGSVVLSNDLYDALGKPSAVEVFVDKEKSVIGLKHSDTTDPDAYVLNFNKDGNRPTFRNKKVFKILGYETIPNGKKDACWDKKEKMVVVKLDG